MPDSRFSRFIDAEELVETAMMLGNTFSPTLHEQPMAEAVYGWLQANKLNPVKQPILADRTNVYAMLMLLLVFPLLARRDPSGRFDQDIPEVPHRWPQPRRRRAWQKSGRVRARQVPRRTQRCPNAQRGGSGRKATRGPRSDHLRQTRPNVAERLRRTPSGR
jgi:hypothetical protein